LIAIGLIVNNWEKLTSNNGFLMVGKGQTQDSVRIEKLQIDLCRKIKKKIQS
jgi:hypothetical protein